MGYVKRIMIFVVNKIKSGNSSVTDQEALEYDLFANNLKPNNKGFSSF